MPHPLHIAFVWHMHQPYYRDMYTGACSMPWVRLHGTKDYLDMVKILEEFPTLHQTFNLVPSLIEQLEEYLPPHHQSDAFLDLSAKPASELTDTEKRFVLEWFFMANWDHMVKPYPRYYDLLAKRGWSVSEDAWPEVLKRFKTQDLLDLQVWFNLAWIDPWLRQRDQELTALETKGSQFSEPDKQLVLAKHRALLSQILPAYRAAAERGQIELTTSPFYHPIMPLVCDTRRAHVALPKMALPTSTFRHPEDARWQLAEGLRHHQARFGQRPQGIWPPEGSVSEELVALAIDEGVRWIATDEEILWRTLRASRAPSQLYRPHRLHRKGKDLAIIFRDRELSDLLGFVYSQWDAAIAVKDFLRRCEDLYQQFRSVPEPALVSIILDGENAWEFYPRDGHEFFRGLYTALSKDDRFRLVTVSEFLAQYPLQQQPSLPELFAGSWIDGNFATWIGHAEKNAAWDFLAQARQTLQQTGPPPSPGTSESREGLARACLPRLPETEEERRRQAWRSFFIAEGSDWMWWYGDTHSSAQDEEFDRLFRTHTANVYRFLGRPVPPALEQPIKFKAVQPLSEPTGPVHPIIDGLETDYYEWLYAGYLDLHKGYSAAHRGQQLLQTLLYGFDDTQVCFRLDLDRAGLQQLAQWRVRLECPDRQAALIIQGHADQVRTATWEGKTVQSLSCAYRKILEVAVPKTLLAARPGETFQLRLSLEDQQQVLETYPTQGCFRLTIPPADFTSQAWSV